MDRSWSKISVLQFEILLNIRLPRYYNVVKLTSIFVTERIDSIRHYISLEFEGDLLRGMRSNSSFKIFICLFPIL